MPGWAPVEGERGLQLGEDEAAQRRPVKSFLSLSLSISLLLFFPPTFKWTIFFSRLLACSLRKQATMNKSITLQGS